MKALTLALVLVAGQPAFAGGYVVPVFDAAPMPVTMPAPASTAVFTVDPWVVGVGIVGLILILSSEHDHHHAHDDSDRTQPARPTDPTDPQPAAVPLPGAAVLLMSAAGALVAVRRRRAGK